jgi:hypothetical protein
MQLTVQQWRNLKGGDEQAIKETDIYPPMLREGDMIIGSVSYEAKKGLFKITMGGCYDGTYDMQIWRISDKKGFLDFLLHIHSKEWITGQHLKDFLDCFFCVVHLKTGEYTREYLGCVWGMNETPSNDTMSPGFAKIMAEIEKD